MPNETIKPIKLRLRYWNCRGRVQSVRYMLEDIASRYSNVDYEEETELIEKALTDWFQYKSDQNIAGPFHSLPVLRWNDTDIFGQTLAVAQLLARKFDLYGKVTSSMPDEDFLRGHLDGVVSCAYTDIISNLLASIWNRRDFFDETDPMLRLLARIADDLKALNTLLEKSSTVFYYDQTEPTIADYFVFEAFTATRDFSSKLLPTAENRHALEKLAETMKQRTGIANSFAQNRLYQLFTGSEKEKEYFARLLAN